MVKDFPIFTLEKILKKAGAERISPLATKELRLTLLEITGKIAKDAIAVAHHAKRKTVKGEDIRFVVK